MKLRIYIQEPGADDGEPREGTCVEYGGNDSAPPVPAPGDEFFVEGMAEPEIVEKRLFCYRKNGDLDVILFVFAGG